MTWSAQSATAKEEFMQLLLMCGIGFAIASVMFALQNNTLVAVTFAIWRFESSLAIVLLLALGLGVLIAGLVSSPTVIKGRWAVARLRRRVADLENTRDLLQRRVAELESGLARTDPDREPDPQPEPSRPYVGLAELITRGPGNTSDGARPDDRRS
jgi:uncharacterized integral membrane protein